MSPKPSINPFKKQINKPSIKECSKPQALCPIIFKDISQKVLKWKYKNISSTNCKPQCIYFFLVVQI